jgi:hypothetical protein
MKVTDGFSRILPIETLLAASALLEQKKKNAFRMDQSNVWGYN